MNIKRSSKLFLFGLIGFLFLLGSCENSAAGGSNDGTDSTGTCDSSTNHTVEWQFSGSYAGTVSVATTWVDPSGDISDPSDVKYTSINPSEGTLLTETLPGCSGASINITMLDGGDDDLVILSNVTLSIYVDGSLADSIDLSGNYGEGTILPLDGALAVVVGQ